tara:strand:+ start:663 stop:1058 length:396 start_codon:yes stop_codon:yes gene_type:complete
MLILYAVGLGYVQMLFACLKNTWSHAALFLQARLATTAEYYTIECPSQELDECGIAKSLIPGANCTSPETALAEMAAFLNVDMVKRPKMHPEALWAPAVTDALLTYVVALVVFMFVTATIHVENNKDTKDA